jgi:chromate reductase, NAD(P)H dehydrogenase (quinone)
MRDDHLPFEVPEQMLPTSLTARPIRLLAISGSLRAASANTTVLRAAAVLGKEFCEISLYTGLGDLPHYNPDLDGENPPAAVLDFRAQLRSADGVLICSPEYAHGVPGVLKNALDWIVSSGEFMGKPVALVNARPASTFAQASLRETLSVMMAEIDSEASVTLPITTNRLDEASLLANPELSNALKRAIAALSRTAERLRTAQESA